MELYQVTLCHKFLSRTVTNFDLLYFLVLYLYFSEILSSEPPQSVEEGLVRSPLSNFVKPNQEKTHMNEEARRFKAK